MNDDEIIIYKMYYEQKFTLSEISKMLHLDLNKTFSILVQLKNKNIYEKEKK